MENEEFYAACGFLSYEIANIDELLVIFLYGFSDVHPSFIEARLMDLQRYALDYFQTSVISRVWYDKYVDRIIARLGIVQKYL